MTGRATKWTWWTALAVLAVLVIFTQLDRQSRYSPQVTALVPDAFQSFAQYHRAAAALKSGSPSETLAQTQQLISKRPLPAENLGMLALAQSKNGSLGRSMNTLQVSAQRGWRDTSTQIAILNLAVATDNGTEAARRFAALLAVDGNQRQIEEGAPHIFAIPAARQEMSRLMQNTPRWGDRWRRLQTRFRSGSQ